MKDAYKMTGKGNVVANNLASITETEAWRRPWHHRTQSCGNELWTRRWHP